MTDIGGVCPNCGKPLAAGEVYRAGYEAGNFRTIPATLGRGRYCDHIPVEKYEKVPYVGYDKLVVSGEEVLPDTPQAYSHSFIVDTGALSDLLKQRMGEAFATTQAEMNRNLYASMWDIKPAKPKLWLSKQISRARHWLAEHLVDLAERVGGYDVRG